MDPLSIATSCVTLVATIGNCSLAITKFIRDVRDARSDLALICNELHSLEAVLVLLQDDFAQPSNNVLPPQLVDHLGSILHNCNDVVAEIEKSLLRHRNSRLGAGGHWTIGGGKDDMTKYRTSLEAHKSALELALEMVTMTVTCDIKKDTTEIRYNSAAIPGIKNDTTQILNEIAHLRARLPADLHQGSSGIILERFLDESTNYAETVVNEAALSELGDWSRTVSRAHTFENFTSYQAPVSYTDFAFYPPEREDEARQFSRYGRSSQVHDLFGNNTPGTSLLTSRHNSKASRIDASSSDMSRLSLYVDNDLEKSRLSPASSRILPASSRPISRSQYHQGPHSINLAALGPTPPTEIQNHLHRPDDWKWITMNHRTQSGNLSLSASEFWTHRYTAMTRAPSYLADLGFKLRQTADPPRETMLLIGIHYPSFFDETEFNPRFATTLDSVMEALAAAPGLCGTPSSGVPWWTTVVVCLLHNETTEAQYVFTRHGLRVRCDTASEHCGMAPENIRDDDNKIYAHLWEHTSSRTKITWNRKGVPEYFTESDTPLQLIQCQYTSRARRPANLGDDEYLLPFIRMLDARSCVSIAAGDKISKPEIFEAYMTTKHKLSSIQVVDPMQANPGARFESSFRQRYGQTPARVYPVERAMQFKPGKRSLYSRLNSIFG
jgi:hypothetical protein